MTRYASFAELRAALAGGDVTLPDGLGDDAPHRTQAQAQAAAQPSSLEALFLHLWTTLGGPELVREYRFDAERRWRFDFALPELRIAFEVDGGLHGGEKRGRHVRPMGYQEDCTKGNAATMAGWRVIRLTAKHLSPLYIEPLIEWVGRYSKSVSRETF